MYITIFKTVGSYYIAQGAQPGALGQPRGVGWDARRQGGSREREHMLLYGRNQHSIVKQLSSN